jgi:pimeloyl-ACP methyl ester carboxylesterase
MNRTTKWLLILALAMVIGGGMLAAWVQTDGGNVTIKDVRFIGTNGTGMSALLYIPKNATAKTPAPGIVAIHGYINSRETQDGFAIEFARRGYVVLAADQTGHGYSDPPAMANGFGGPDSLRYIRTLDIVDKDNIGLEGHSMGGWALVVAAQTYTNEYKSMVLEGSSTGTYGGNPGTATFPRNLGLVFSKWDEFSALMWNSPVPADIVKTPKLQAAFGISPTVVEVGKLYGSVADGTARKLYQPAVTHPGDHISTEAIGDAVEWFQLTLKGGNGLPPSNQTWYWKEFGTLVALIGMMLFLFPFGAWLLSTSYFKSLVGAVPVRMGISGRGWWLGALITVAVPALTFFQLQHTGNDWIKASPLWPQNITIGIMAWAVGNGLITLVLFLLWHFGLNRKNGATFANYGVTWSGSPQTATPATTPASTSAKTWNWGAIGKSLLLAVCIIVPAYLLLALSDYFFKTDFRIWVLAVKLMSPVQFRIFLSFLVPFTFFFLVLGTALHGQLRASENMAKEMVVNVLLLITGIVVLLVVQYVPLLAGGTLFNPAESLLSIVAFQFVPLLSVVAMISTYFYRRTGHIYVGAFLNAMLITWIIVASTATHLAV